MQVFLTSTSGDNPLLLDSGREVQESEKLSERPASESCGPERK